MMKFIKSIFFGNYFIGLIAIALSVESCVQLRLAIKLTYLLYYTFFRNCFLLHICLYRVRYSSNATINPRKEWYRKNHRFILWSQRFFYNCVLILALFFYIKNFKAIENLPVLLYWLILVIMLLSGFFYYGLLPKSFYKINLRNTGWLKAFIIGFVWACCANFLSVLLLFRLKMVVHTAETILLIWLFVKNWMFCTVNAIIFDIKDYADDSNKAIKNFCSTLWIKKNDLFYFVAVNSYWFVFINCFCNKPQFWCYYNCIKSSSFYFIIDDCMELCKSRIKFYII